MKFLEQNHTDLSIRQQCSLLGLCRSSYYYEPVPCKMEDLNLTCLIDAIYTENPTYGSRRITEILKRHGFNLYRNRVVSLMEMMGISAVYPKKRTTFGNEQHLKYPYLLSNFEIIRPNQVWATDITYIRMKKGFLYLVAIIDWHSRYVLAWRLSNTLEMGFCIDVLNEALARHPKPEIFNSDQGCQFTSPEFTGVLLSHGIKISMAGKGRCYDNIFTERLWRTIKYEEVYLNSYLDGFEAERYLSAYIEKYNHRRPHQSLCYRTPYEVHFDLPKQLWVNLNQQNRGIAMENAMRFPQLPVDFVENASSVLTTDLFGRLPQRPQGNDGIFLNINQLEQSYGGMA